MRWTPKLFLSIRAVDNHRNNMKKVKIKKADLVKMAIG
jgi:DNA-binding CsgD family transcriptional regulator